MRCSTYVLHVPLYNSVQLLIILKEVNMSFGTSHLQLFVYVYRGVSQSAIIQVLPPEIVKLYFGI